MTIYTKLFRRNSFRTTDTRRTTQEMFVDVVGVLVKHFTYDDRYETSNPLTVCLLNSTNGLPGLDPPLPESNTRF